MTSPLRIIFLTILILSLTQLGYGKTSTDNPIVQKSDILKPNKSIEIEELDFIEDIQVKANDYTWTINLKTGPLSTEQKATEEALKLKEILHLKLPELKKEIYILNNLNLEHPPLPRDSFSWTINFKIDGYPSKEIAMLKAQKIRATQKFPESVFLTRESKVSETNSSVKDIKQEVFGHIFLSSTKTNTRKTTKQFILIDTNSNSLNVRAKPSSSSPIVASLIKGSKVPLVNQSSSDSINKNWFHIEYTKGKFGWVSSRYTKKIKTLENEVSQLAKIKTKSPKKNQLSDISGSNELGQLKSLVVVLRKELSQIKSDKARAIDERIDSRKQLEVSVNKINKKIKNLQVINTSLHSELDKTNSEKARAIIALDKAMSEVQNIKLENAKKSKFLKSENKNETDNLKIKVATLQKELEKLKLDQVKLFESIDQSSNKTKEDKLASIKALESLKETTSNQITNLQTINASLRSELDKTNSDKANAIETANQASSKLKEDKLASIKALESLKETTSNQITNLQTI
ncbi:MAG: SH3 domain-containing protein, partial [Nitrospina sp.]|nr:SH3 domain-containing protein [Nitrospina sp.]